MHPALPAAAIAQASPNAPAIVASAAACTARIANLGGIGRARIVAFEAPISGLRACATVAVLNPGTYAAALGAAPDAAAPALVTLLAGADGPASVPLGDLALSGRWVVAPGGAFPDDIASDRTTASRVVVAFAGQQTLLIATSPVYPVDLTRIFRDQPDLFGADAFERALLVASPAGGDPVMTVQTDDGTFSEAEPAAPAPAEPPGPALRTVTIRKR